MLIAGAIVIAAAFLPSPVVYAATTDQYGGHYNYWPGDGQWVPIVSLNDQDDGVAEQLDFVGDANSPGAYVATDNNYVYVRARIDVGTATTSTFEDSIFVLIDRVGYTDHVPDYAFVWDTKGAVKVEHGLEFQVTDVTGSTWATTKLNDIDGSIGQKIAPPDFGASNGNGYIRTVDSVSTTNFGTTTFVDYAVSWSYLSAQSTLAPGQSWRIQLGSIQNATDHNFITTDVAGGSNPTSQGLDWSEPILMNDPPVESGSGTPVPEPATMAGFAIAGIVLAIRKFPIRRLKS